MPTKSLLTVMRIVMMVVHGGERRLLDELDALEQDHGAQGEHHYGDYRSQHHDEPGLCQNVIGQVVIDGVPGQTNKGRTGIKYILVAH